jgi:hypothetical protein
LAVDKCDGDNVMPARNRVTPTGEIEAIALRGAWTGNRGILHCGREIVRFHASDLWITCALEFRGRWHEQEPLVSRPPVPRGLPRGFGLPFPGMTLEAAFRSRAA